MGWEGLGGSQEEVQQGEWGGSVVRGDVSESEGKNHIPLFPVICWWPGGKGAHAAVLRRPPPRLAWGLLSIPLPPPPPRSMLHPLCGPRVGVRDPGPGQTVPPPLPRRVLQGAKGASACSPKSQEGSSPEPEPAEGPRAGFAPGVTPSMGAVGTPKQVRSWSFQSL